MYKVINLGGGGWLVDRDVILNYIRARALGG